MLFIARTASHKPATAQTRESHHNHYVSSRGAGLIPAAHGAAFVVQLVGVLPGECDLEGTVLGGDGGGVVPLEVTRLPIVEVGIFTKGTVAGVENSFVVVEFVREDQIEFRLVVEGSPRHRPIWSIDETSGPGSSGT